MSLAVVACPNCGLAVTRKNGRDRQGGQFHQCLGCRRRCTALTATPFSGYRFPVLAVYSIRHDSLAVYPQECQDLPSDGVNGQDRCNQPLDKNSVTRR